MKNLLLVLIVLFLGTTCLAQAPNMYKKLSDLLQVRASGKLIPTYVPKKFTLNGVNPIDNINTFAYILEKDTIMQMLTVHGPMWVKQDAGTKFRAYKINGLFEIYARDDCGNPVYKIYDPITPLSQLVKLQGPPGRDGIDGIDGIDGKDATIENDIGWTTIIVAAIVAVAVVVVAWILHPGESKSSSPTPIGPGVETGGAGPGVETGGAN